MRRFIFLLALGLFITTPTWAAEPAPPPAAEPVVTTEAPAAAEEEDLSKYSAETLRTYVRLQMQRVKKLEEENAVLKEQVRRLQDQLRGATVVVDRSRPPAPLRGGKRFGSAIELMGEVPMPTREGSIADREAHKEAIDSLIGATLLTRLQITNVTKTKDGIRVDGFQLHDLQAQRIVIRATTVAEEKNGHAVVKRGDGDSINVEGTITKIEASWGKPVPKYEAVVTPRGGIEFKLDQEPRGETRPGTIKVTLENCTFR